MITQPMFRTLTGERVPTSQIKQSRGLHLVHVVPAAAGAADGAVGADRRPRRQRRHPDAADRRADPAAALARAAPAARGRAVAAHRARGAVARRAARVRHACCSSRRSRARSGTRRRSVGVALALVYTWASIEAKRPITAGLALGAAALTRTSMAFMLPLFLFELWRVPARRTGAAPLAALRDPRSSAFAIAGHDLQRRPVPLADRVRPHVPRRPPADPDRAVRPRELSLPRAQPRGRVHAAARAAAATRRGCRSAATASRSGSRRPRCSTCCGRARSRRSIARCGSPSRASRAPSLFYMNSGWVQFGYRFSLDYMVFLIVLLAIGGRPPQPQAADRRVHRDQPVRRDARSTATGSTTASAATPTTSSWHTDRMSISDKANEVHAALEQHPGTEQIRQEIKTVLVAPRARGRRCATRLQEFVGRAPEAIGPARGPDRRAERRRNLGPERLLVPAIPRAAVRAGV